MKIIIIGSSGSGKSTLAREIAKLPAKDRINDFPDYLINRAKKLKNLYSFFLIIVQ